MSMLLDIFMTFMYGLAWIVVGICVLAGVILAITGQWIGVILCLLTIGAIWGVSKFVQKRRGKRDALGQRV